MREPGTFARVATLFHSHGPSVSKSTPSRKTTSGSLLLEPGTKIRTLKYQLSVYAKVNPLTDEQLKFAKSLCPAWANIGHCRCVECKVIDTPVCVF